MIHRTSQMRGRSRTFTGSSNCLINITATLAALSRSFCARPSPYIPSCPPCEPRSPLWLSHKGPHLVSYSYRLSFLQLDSHRHRRIEIGLRNPPLVVCGHAGYACLMAGPHANSWWLRPARRPNRHPRRPCSGGSRISDCNHFISFQPVATSENGVSPVLDTLLLLPVPCAT